MALQLGRCKINEAWNFSGCCHHEDSCQGPGSEPPLAGKRANGPRAHGVGGASSYADAHGLGVSRGRQISRTFLLHSAVVYQRKACHELALILFSLHLRSSPASRFLSDCVRAACSPFESPAALRYSRSYRRRSLSQRQRNSAARYISAHPA
jgi:hypothetical protein